MRDSKSPNFLKMRVLILIDADNFRNGVANIARSRGQFRYVDYYKINKFILDYLSNNLQYQNCKLVHLRTYLYSGEYTDNLIRRIESTIKRENDEVRRKVLREKLESAQKNKKVQIDFLRLAKNYYFFEVRTKPLQFSPSKISIFQKGIDVQIAVDLVEFSYKNVFDIVVLLSGDIDLLESVRTAKRLGKHVIIFCDDSIMAEEMKREADLFINLARFTDEQLDKISHLKESLGGAQ